MTSNGGATFERSQTDVEDIEKVFALAAEMQQQLERAAGRRLFLRMLQVLFAVATIVVSFLCVLMLGRVSKSFLIAGTVAAGLSVFYATALERALLRASVRTRQDRFALAELVAVLHEVAGGVGLRDGWSPLDQARFRIRLSRLELLTKKPVLGSGLSGDRSSSGCVRVLSSFQSPFLEWERLFEEARHVDLMFSYASTWRNQYIESMRRLVRRSGVSVRVLLPDPNNSTLLGELARRFSQSPEKTAERIGDAIAYFESIGKIARDNGATVAVAFMNRSPVFTFYRFDSSGILAMYSHRQERVAVPALVCSAGNPLFDFASEEFDRLMSEAQPQS